MRARLATGAISADPAFCPLWSGWPIDSSLFAPLEARATVRPESLDARSCCQQIPSGLTRPRRSLGTVRRDTLASLCGSGELAKEGAVSGPKSPCWGSAMSEPERPQLSPYQVELQAGKRYAWCRCGRSQKQPFCDGSHAGTGIEPLMFTAERDETALLCGCKDTGDPPFCDGSHLLL